MGCFGAGSLRSQDRRTHSEFPIVSSVNRSGLAVTIKGFSLPLGLRVHPAGHDFSRTAHGVFRSGLHDVDENSLWFDTNIA